MDNSNFFPPLFEEENTEEDEECIADECICSECGGVFILPPDVDIEECPLCGAVYD